MKTADRDFIYESNDFRNMCRFIIDDNTQKRSTFIWHIGRIVDWKYNLYNQKKYFPANFSDYTHMWYDYFGELAGFAYPRISTMLFLFL